MTYAEFEAVVNKFSYKKDCSISCSHGIYDCVQIYMTKNVEDVDGKYPGQIPIRAIDSITYSSLREMNEANVKSLIVEMVKRMELHEMDEWLKFDGDWINDPHPELRPLKLELKWDEHFSEDAMRYAMTYAALDKVVVNKEGSIKPRKGSDVFRNFMYDSEWWRK